MKFFSCPRCGEKVSVASSALDGDCECTGCGKKYSVQLKSESSPSGILTANKESTTASPTPPKLPWREISIPKPPSISTIKPAGSGPESSAIETDTELLERNIEETSLFDPLDSTSGESISCNAVSILAAKRKRARNWVAGFWLAILVISSATAIIVLVQVAKATRNNQLSASLDSDPKTEFVPDTKSTEPATPDNSDQAPQNGLQQNDNQTKAIDVTAQQPRQPEKPIEWGKPRNLSRRDLEKFWVQAQPYIVRLTVNRGDKSRLIGGVIVDSRGWIATSLSAIKGASSINVEPAPVNPLSERLDQALSDDVRGVLAVDPTHDLVILQVNRRLVNVVTSLQPSTQSTVGGRYLIQVAPPGKERNPWITECKVNQERPREKFSTSVNRQFDSLQINLEPYWPAHDGVLENAAGATLFSPDGNFSGVNSSVSDGSDSFFVEAAAVLALTNNVKEPAQPLTSLVAAATHKAAAPVAPATPTTPDAKAKSGRSPFETDHEFYQPSQELFLRAALCEAFNWQPQTNEQQSELVAGLLALRETGRLTRGRRLVTSDRELLQSQVAFWNNRLTETICNGDRDAEQAQNQLARGAVNDKNEIECAVFASVLSTPLTSPKIEDQETVTLLLTGIDEHVIVPVDQEKNASMLPDSRWIMVLVLDPKNTRTINLNQGSSVQAIRGSSLREIREVR